MAYSVTDTTGNASESDDYDDYSQSQASSWQIQPQFDFPGLFPYHTGFNSVHAGATTTINSPSVVDSSATSSGVSGGNPRLRSLGIQELLDELHQKQLGVKRPKRRLLATTLPQAVGPAKEEKLRELRRIQNELTLRRVNHFASATAAAIETELEVARLQGKIAKLGLELGEDVIARDAMQARKRVLQMVHGRKYLEVAKVAVALGDVQNNLGEYFDANESYLEALDTNSLDELEQGVCFISMGRTLLNQGDSKEALQSLSKGYKLLLDHQQRECRTVGHELLLDNQHQEDGEVLRLMAIAETESGEPIDGALARLRVSRQIFRSQQDHANLVETIMATAYVHSHVGDHDMAQKCYEECRKIVKKKITDGDLELRCLARIHLEEGDLYLRQHETMRATDCYLDALSTFRKLEEDFDRMDEVLVALGDLNCCRQDDLALSYYQQVETTETSLLHRHVLLKRGILYFKSGEYGPACQDFQTYCFCCRQDKGASLEDQAYLVALFSQGVCQYLMGGNNAKAKKLCKEALSHSRSSVDQNASLDPCVRKALKKCMSKMHRTSISKVLSRLRGQSRVSRAVQLGTVTE